MDILNRLLRLLGLHIKVGGKVQENEDRLPVKAPEPIHLSPSQRQQIERRIAEFIADSSAFGAHACAREAIASLNALPLLFDWTAFMALRLDGQIVWVPYDEEPDDIQIVLEERVRNTGLFQTTKLHPELQFLLPPMTPDAIDCPDCRGTGKLTFPQSSEHLADKLVCYCGGLGWLPHGGKN